MISQRVKSGMENAKAKGKQIGRATTTKAEIEENKKFMKFYKEYQKGKLNVSDLANVCEMSRTTVYKYIKILKGTN
ncbi:MAG: HTH domain-containing protein [Clostridium perfringens]|nr:HTH domain-containing protein [Clostridium perfringens]